jgi:hypothetical protein
MAKRQETSDLMADLLGGPGRPAAETASRQNRKTAKQQNAKIGEEEQERVKLTVYIPENTAYALEKAKLTLRQTLKPASMNDISKSTIVEAALSLALADLDEKGSESLIAQKLA